MEPVHFPYGTGLASGRPNGLPKKTGAYNGSRGGNSNSVGNPRNIVQLEKHKAKLAVEEAKKAKPVGSALKDDPAHRSASFMLDKAAEEGRVFSVRGGDGVNRNLIQVEGDLNGTKDLAAAV